MTLVQLESIDALREEWTAVAQRSGNVFLTWEWASAWWSIYGQGRRLLLYGARNPRGELVAIFPLYLASERGLRVARLIGHGVADELGPICGHDDREAAALAVGPLLHEALGRRGLLFAERLRGDQGWEERLGGRVVRRQSTPTLKIDGRTWEDWLVTRSANFRQQHNRLERRLEREHKVTMRLVVGGQELDWAFGELVRLHQARWGGASSAFTPDRQRFHQRFLALAGQRGWPRLWLATAGNQVVAAWMGFRFGGAEWYYQSGRDPAYNATSVGRVLLMRTLRAAFDDGLSEYRFLLGDEAYKRRFSNADPQVTTMLIGHRPATAAVGLAADAAHHLPQALRSDVLRSLRT
jgi:CelD/BcsL family acetyltransferase involved in cellulose biosynthesis